MPDTSLQSCMCTKIAKLSAKDCEIICKRWRNYLQKMAKLSAKDGEIVRIKLSDRIFQHFFLT